MAKDDEELAPIPAERLYHFDPSTPEPKVVGYYKQEEGPHFEEPTYSFQITIPHCFENPVAFARSQTQRAPAPGIIEPTFLGCNENGESTFNLMFHEFSYLDGFHFKEIIGLLVFEEGNHTLEDGSLVSVMRGSANNTTWAEFTLDENLDKDNSIFISQVLSREEDHARVTRQRLKNGKLQIIVMAEEKITANGEESHSEVGALILTKGAESPFVTKKIEADHNWVSVHFTEKSSYNSTYFTDIFGFKGRDTAYSTATRDEAEGIKVMIAEETSKDEETDHFTEDIHILYIPSKEGSFIGTTQ